MDEFFLTLSSMSDGQLDWLSDNVPGEVFWPYHFSAFIKGAYAGLTPGNYKPYLYARFDACIKSRTCNPGNLSNPDYPRTRLFWGQWFAASKPVLRALPAYDGQSPTLREILHQTERSQFVKWSSNWRNCEFSDSLCVPVSSLLDFPEMTPHGDKSVRTWQYFEDFQDAAKAGKVIVPPPGHKLVGYTLATINYNYRLMEKPVPMPMFEPL